MPIENVVPLAGEPTKNRDLRSRGKETVSRLLEAGQEVVVERGHDEARVDDIVERAGLSHGTFYLYFRDREDLLHSLIRLAGRQLTPLAEQLRGVPTAEALSTWIGHLVDEFDRHAEVLRAARALSTDEAVAELAEPLARWLGRVPGAKNPGLAASMLLWHVERAAVRDDILDHDEVAELVMCAVSCRGR